jgi:hypothetical protein
MKRGSGPCVSLAEAAQAAGFKGERRAASKRLQRLILAKERRTGRELMLRLRGPHGRVRFRVSMWVLRRRMPELFDPATEAEKAIRNLIRTEMQEVRAQMDHVTEDVEVFKRSVAKVLQQHLGRRGTR